jgi:hypothetical protein
MVVNARWATARAFSISVACRTEITYLTNHIVHVYLENCSHPTKSFTTTFTKCHHMVLPNARSVHCTSAHPYSNTHINIILPSVARPLQGASPKVCNNSYLPHTIHVPPSQYPWFGSYNIIMWRRQSIKLPIM